MDLKEIQYLKKGTVLVNRYVIEDVLGQGGFGITYVGNDTLFNTIVAIKELFPQGIVMRNREFSSEISVVTETEIFENSKQRFINEARVIARFSNNQGIVNVKDYFEANNTVYIVMEYLPGETLKSYLEKNGNLSPDETLRMMVPLIESLSEIHGAGMIHRDISPDNIMMLPSGQIKLMDFGAARDYTDSGANGLSVILKAGYTPIEQHQVKGVQGPWTDIYALSATIYRCITGKIPENALDRVLIDNLKKPSAMGIVIDHQLENALMKGLHVHPEERYQDLQSFCNDMYHGWNQDQKHNEEGVPGKSFPADENEESTEDDSFRKEEIRWKPYVLAVSLVLLLSLTGILFAVGKGNPLSLVKKEYIPDLVGMSLEEAEKWAENNEKTIEVVDARLADDGEKPGDIVGQKPEEGELSEDYDTINVEITSESVALKDIVDEFSGYLGFDGRPISEAGKQKLEENFNLETAEITSNYIPGYMLSIGIYEEGSADPRPITPSDQIPLHAKLRLVLSKEKTELESGMEIKDLSIEDLIGKSFKEVYKTANKQGFYVGIDNEKIFTPASQARKAEIAALKRADSREGESAYLPSSNRIRTGDRLSLLFSKGPKGVYQSEEELEPFIGQKAANVQSEIEKHHLTVSRSEKDSSSVAAGYVINIKAVCKHNEEELNSESKQYAIHWDDEVKIVVSKGKNPRKKNKPKEKN